MQTFSDSISGKNIFISCYLYTVLSLGAIQADFRSLWSPSSLSVSEVPTSGMRDTAAPLGAMGEDPQGCPCLKGRGPVCSGYFLRWLDGGSQPFQIPIQSGDQATLHIRPLLSGAGLLLPGSNEYCVFSDRVPPPPPQR